MEIPERLVLHPTAHPVPLVHRAGFPLDHPYLEHCWAPSLGPTGVVLLRRAAWLWLRDAPAAVPASDLGQMVGVGRGIGTQSRLSRTLDRLERFGFLQGDGESGHLAVYTKVPPVPDRHLQRLPAATQRVHDALLSEHLDQFTREASTPARDAAERVSRRLVRLEQTAPAVDLTLNR